MPKGLKPVRRKVAALDARAQAAQAARAAAQGTVARLWDLYRDSPEWRALKPRTRSDYQKVRDWLGKAAERAVLRRIVTAEIVHLRDKAFREKGRRFANYVVQVLRILLAWGKLRGHLDGNPAAEVPALRKPVGAAKVNRAWSAAEVAAFAAAAPPQLLAPFALGLFAGMRQGDALIVTWKAYDGVALRWIAGKNGEACMAPVTAELKKILDDAKAHRGETLQIATTSTGSAWTQNGFRASFFKLVRKLVKAGKLQPGCTFHGLRHTLAAGARDAGESESRVAAAIGDRSPAMAQIYGRDADRQGAQMAILEAAQKRFANIEWKTRTENASKKPAKRTPRNPEKA